MSQYQRSAQYDAGGTGRQTAGQAGAYRFPTASHLSADVRTSTIEQLNRTLADLTVLQKHAKFAHWNVKGMAFYGLHDLFDDLAEVLESHVDLVAERITALGGQAMGTAGQAVASCRLPPMPTDAVTGQDYVDVMTERLAVADANLYEDIEVATDLGDVDTADLLNEVSREVSTYRWFVEAHLQTRPIGATGQQPGGQAIQPQGQGQSQGAALPQGQQQPRGVQSQAGQGQQAGTAREGSSFGGQQAGSAGEQAARAGGQPAQTGGRSTAGSQTAGATGGTQPPSSQERLATPEIQ